MSWIGWLLFLFGAVRLAVSAVNRFSRPYLPPVAPFCGKERVSVLIPARNEERTLPFLLGDLLDMRQELHEILVYDDQSDDRTAHIVLELAATCSCLRLIPGRELPAGWLGKNHACDCLASAASGDVFLFVDADVRLAPGTILRAVRYMRDSGVMLLSVFPRQQMPTLGTELAVPLMNWILLSLLPLAAVRRMPHPSLSAANGQFMVFTGASYRTMRPHRLCRLAAAEDIAIVRVYKAHAQPVAVLLGRDDVSCRMYDSLRGAVAGFARNIFQFFGGRSWVCYGYATVTTAAPLLIFYFNGPAAGVLYVGMVVLNHVFVSQASAQSVVRNLVLLLPQQLVLWRIIFTASLHRWRKDLRWKGRNIYRRRV